MRRANMISLNNSYIYRAVNVTYGPAINCDKFSSVAMSLKDCEDQGRTSSGHGGPFVWAMSSVEAQVASRCR